MALLDALDGDPDLEPELGSLDRVWPRYVAADRDYSSCQFGWGRGARDDREDDVDTPEGDGEPSPAFAVRRVRRPRLPTAA